MRTSGGDGDFKVKAISGIHTVLLALDCAEPRRKGLLGFGVKRDSAGRTQGEKWLRSQKVFKSIEPNPKNRTICDPSKPKRIYTTNTPSRASCGVITRPHPIRNTISRADVWQAGRADQDARRDQVQVTTEKEWNDGKSTASGSTAAPSRARNSPRNSATIRRRTSTIRKTRTVIWLSRGLLEACLAIHQRDAGR